MIIAKGAARRLGFGRSSSAYPVRAACSADAAEAIAALSLFATWLSQLETLNGRRDAHSRRAWRIRDEKHAFTSPFARPMFRHIHLPPVESLVMYRF